MIAAATAFAAVSAMAVTSDVTAAAPVASAPIDSAPPTAMSDTAGSAASAPSAAIDSVRQAPLAPSDVLWHTGIIAALLIGVLLYYWGLTKVLPRAERLARGWEGTAIRPLRAGRHVIVSDRTLGDLLLALVAATRPAVALVIVWFASSLALGPAHTEFVAHYGPHVRAVLIVVFVAYALVVINRFFPRVYGRLREWEQTLIRPLRLGQHDVLSATEIGEWLVVIARGLRITFALLALSLLGHMALDVVPRSEAVWAAWRDLTEAGLIAVAMLITLRTVGVVYRVLRRRIDEWQGTLVRAIRVKQVELVSQERIAELLEAATKATYTVIVVLVFYVGAALIFTLFHATETWAATLLGYIVRPARATAIAIAGYLPNVFTIAVIVFVAYWAIRSAKWFFVEVGRGTIALPGFYTEWAEPTYKIVRFLIIAFIVVVIFPYLPGSSSPAFRGVSIFIGVIFSLGSSSSVANIIAGIVLTYMRAFTPGDRVKIADTVGDVVEKTLLITRVRTIKNVDITIPNAMVLGSHIINYSSSCRDSALILHTTITIGYDVPWRKVHDLLTSAALKTERILRDPAPFVLQTGLNDYNISYELNAYTDDPAHMAATYSVLHQNIQDAFNEAAVEILSPAYSAIRDGNRSTVPEDHLPPDYTAPSFRVGPLSQLPGRRGAAALRGRDPETGEPSTDRE